MTILYALAAITAGFVGLIWSADRFVLGASTTARNLGVSPLVIGLTIVAFGTSSPEIFASAVAALKGSPEIALGNVIGSNLANIALVLAITLLIHPVSIPKGLTHQELPVMAALTAVCFILFYDLRLDAIDGFLLLIMLIAFGWNIWRTRIGEGKTDAEHSALVAESEVQEFIAPISTLKAMGLMTLGLILMILSSNILIWGAKSIALTLGLSELVVGLTIVAIGTSLPELATSVTSALKGHDELALGNIVGSNILNLLLVLPVPAFLAPFSFSHLVLWRDYAVMAGITFLLCILIVIASRKSSRLGRFTGSVLLMMYIAYTSFLLLTA